jgi:hypothetical protein
LELIRAHITIQNLLTGEYMSDTPNTDEGVSRNIDELKILNELIATLAPLHNSAKKRILQTVITFLRLDLDTSARGSAPLLSTSGTDGSPVSSFSTRNEMSPKQFLLEKQPANDIERVACLAYYLTHFRGTPEFKTIDISTLNTEAAQPKFSNPSVPIEHATRRGFLVSTSGWSKQLGAIGEQFVQALPDRDAAKAVLERVRIRKPRKKRNVEGAVSQAKRSENE